ncbi:MAG TPA: TAT-variant-translocated molybdopterin oxidoreductase [Bryobacteraceae bacterium]|jgi:molybdopterin-containing oxidoreductase family iron-sulfur binding subunit
MKDSPLTQLNGSGSGLVPLESLLDKPRKTGVNLEALREKLAAGRGPAFWRTLDEAAESEDLREYIEQEFPGLSGQIPQGVDRRSLLKVMAASLAMAGAAACTKQPKELIVPYVRQPENLIPGTPLFYATAMPTGGYARGLLVESHLNRPTKVEGNPDHPASLGSTTIFEQASILNLYDPDRSENVLYEGRLSTWSEFTGKFITEAQELATRKGEGLAILTGVTTSPTLLSQMKALQTQWPTAKWYVHEPSVNPAIASAAKKIAGRPALLTYDISKADVIVNLGSDFLNNGPAAMMYARQFGKRRSVTDNPNPCRMYAIESAPTVSGSLADHHFTVKCGDIPAIAYQLAKAVGVAAPDAPGTAPAWLGAVAQDLTNSKGRSLVIPGEFQPESVHLAAHLINAALGNADIVYAGLEPDNTYALDDLTTDLNNGHVETLLILGPNPVYTAPASLDFETAIRKARLVVRLGQFFDETSRWSHWHIPEAHYLETWSDSRAFNGTITIQQPLIEPLYNGKSAHEVLTILLGKPDQSSHEVVKAYWQEQNKAGDFDTLWKTSLHNGWVEGTAVSPMNGGAAVSLPALETPSGSGFEVVLRPDPTIGDGSWANNGWLQELPKPQSKTTWDNIVYISPKDATKMNVTLGDMLRVTVAGKSTVGPAFIMPGHAENSITVFFGYGRTGSGRVGNRIGYNAYLIQDAASPYLLFGSIEKTGEHYRIANVQETQTMAGREPVREANIAEFREHPDFPTMYEKPLPPAETLYAGHWSYTGYKWGMAIDLSICTGCSACIIACQAENNIAVVGKDQVARGRHMHWIRVDRYYSGNLDEPEMYNQPVPCMHCEDAPCEVVCPVGATTHSSEGINQMIYNRCVGTRYCSNNCPYKVRRFNFYLYSDWNTESEYGMRNPDVTVRSRGVMEKCSYCIQRIQETKIKTEKEDRRVRDGEILTACQQVCPTQAITFGDLNDPGSRVTKLQASKRNYGLLDDLNTRPRTTYLGYVRNPNEALRG